ncbi:hypothetical protein GCM10009677_54990 [Sphaerisporangium rubeum]|uniref:Anti-sigma regulatory factor (Ser/Thr protein kinase) n=1 Tax=Sphaerisporangium rubeum TaxID=321317 RepID=A0A7X0M902_9ACTN|nr:ATP-binding protein [Sphaerisporangium rubeum]MBB6474456.1 anti-sigma regulatory factor (Ser/Thr protein kinase) [Sphaerisporangium rubeum]
MRTGILLGVTDLAGTPESASTARDFVRLKLGENHPALDDVTLLVSELVTNSVLHSNSKNGGKITLAIADCHDLIHVDVTDAGGPATPEVHQDDLSEGGRGLLLVKALSHKWAVHDDPAGRTVWFQVKYNRGKTQPPPAHDPADRSAASDTTDEPGTTDTEVVRRAAATA